MMIKNVNPTDMKVFLTHVYEFKKGVRQMVLYTMYRRNQEFAVNRLKKQRIRFIIQEVDDERINLVFRQGRVYQCHTDDSYTSAESADTGRGFHFGSHARV